jgi:hypothetical protein
MERASAELASFWCQARAAASEGERQGRPVRDDLLVDADAEHADAEAHVAALPVVAGTLAVTDITGSVAGRWRPNAVCFSPARASELVR